MTTQFDITTTPFEIPPPPPPSLFHPYGGARRRRAIRRALKVGKYWGCISVRRGRRRKDREDLVEARTTSPEMDYCLSRGIWISSCYRISPPLFPPPPMRVISSSLSGEGRIYEVKRFMSRLWQEWSQCKFSYTSLYRIEISKIRKLFFSFFKLFSSFRLKSMEEEDF